MVIKVIEDCFAINCQEINENECSSSRSSVVYTIPFQKYLGQSLETEKIHVNRDC